MADTLNVIPNDDKCTVVSVSWEMNTEPPHSSDWIGLFKAGDPDGKQMKYHYTYGAKRGTVTFDLQPFLKKAEQFDFRLFSSKKKLATSTSFTPSSVDVVVQHNAFDQNDLALMAAEASQASYEVLEEDFDYALFDHQYPDQIHEGIRILVPKKTTPSPLIIFALRGSVTLEDASHDSQLAANWFLTDGKESKLRERVENASTLLLYILKKLKTELGGDFALLLTGHSLGGFIAQILYAHHQKEFPQLVAHTQNAPGAKDVFVKWYSHMDFDDSKCFNHRMTSDLVSLKGGHIGKVISYGGTQAGLRAIWTTGAFLAGFKKDNSSTSLIDVLEAWKGTHGIGHLITQMKKLKIEGNQ